MLASVLALICVEVTGADIYKCVDVNGNVTYQETTCPPSTTASRIEIVDSAAAAIAPDEDARWAAQANAHQVTVGMPKRLVRLALGDPTAISTRLNDGATETWVYATADRTRLIGFSDGAVLWSKSEAPFEEKQPVATPSSGEPKREPKPEATPRKEL